MRLLTLRVSLGLLFLVASCASKSPKLIFIQHLPKMEKRDLQYLSFFTFNAKGERREPVNFAVVGNKRELFLAFIAGGWEPADPHHVVTVTKEVESFLMGKSYRRAPVSDLFLFGRKHDFAFQIEVGGSPEKRHHIRFWKTPITVNGRSVWAGAATYDNGVNILKLDHTVCMDLDKERDFIVKSIRKGKRLARHKWIPGVGKIRPHLKKQGEPLSKSRDFYTDGRVSLVTVSRSSGPSHDIESPPENVAGGEEEFSDPVLKDLLSQR